MSSGLVARDVRTAIEWKPETANAHAPDPLPHTGARVEPVDVLWGHDLYRRANRRWDLFVVQYIEHDLNEIVPISLGKRGDGANQSSLRTAQFSTSLRESPDSESKAQIASPNFGKRPECTENSKIIDAADEGLAFW
jgi:hypothetical protein